LREKKRQRTGRTEEYGEEWKRGKKGRNIKGERNKMKLLSSLVLHPIHQKKEPFHNE
jgi:hypothetical protein